MSRIPSPTEKRDAAVVASPHQNSTWWKPCIANRSDMGLCRLKFLCPTSLWRFGALGSSAIACVVSRALARAFRCGEVIRRRWTTARRVIENGTPEISRNEPDRGPVSRRCENHARTKKKSDEFLGLPAAAAALPLALANVHVTRARRTTRSGLARTLPERARSLPDGVPEPPRGRQVAARAFRGGGVVGGDGPGARRGARRTLPPRAGWSSARSRRAATSRTARRRARRSRNEPKGRGRVRQAGRAAGRKRSDERFFPRRESRYLTSLFILDSVHNQHHLLSRLPSAASAPWRGPRPCLTPGGACRGPRAEPAAPRAR